MAAAVLTSEMSPHVPCEYALPADGRRDALVSHCGDMTRMCAPRCRDNAVSACLLALSKYSVTPVGRCVCTAADPGRNDHLAHSHLACERPAVERSHLTGPAPQMPHRML